MAAVISVVWDMNKKYAQETEQHSLHALHTYREQLVVGANMKIVYWVVHERRACERLTLNTSIYVIRRHSSVLGLIIGLHLSLAITTGSLLSHRLLLVMGDSAEKKTQRRKRFYSIRFNSIFPITLHNTMPLYKYRELSKVILWSLLTTFCIFIFMCYSCTFILLPFYCCNCVSSAQQ